MQACAAQRTVTEMKLRDLSFASIVIVVVGGLYLLSFVGKAKELPGDECHFAVSERSQCLSCHLPEKMFALERTQKHLAHCRKEQISCLLCHKRGESARKVVAGVVRESK